MTQLENVAKISFHQSVLSADQQARLQSRRDKIYYILAFISQKDVVCLLAGGAGHAALLKKGSVCTANESKSEEKSVQLVRGSFAPKQLLTKSIL